MSSEKLNHRHLFMSQRGIIGSPHILFIPYIQHTLSGEGDTLTLHLLILLL